MIDFDLYSEELLEVNSVSGEMYQNNFSYYFESVRSLNDRLSSKTHPITDEELEEVLTTLPLNLFSASEALNKLKLEQEVIKLQNKKRKVEIQKNLPEKSKISKSDWIASELADSEIALAIYSSVISRAESEMTYCKELIMGCKKIWDSRRLEEKSSPIAAQDSSNTLPEYDVANNRKYPIYGS